MPNIFIYCIQKDYHIKHCKPLNINIKYNFYKIADYVENQYNNFI
jgi:hypothetical protein